MSFEKTKKNLEDIWNRTFTPSKAKIDPIFRSHVGRQDITITYRDAKKLPERLLSAGRTHHNIISATSGSIIIFPPSYHSVKLFTIKYYHCCIEIIFHKN